MTNSMTGKCQVCSKTFELDHEMETIIRHDDRFKKRCHGSYKPAQEVIDSIDSSETVTLFRGTISASGEIIRVDS